VISYGDRLGRFSIRHASDWACIVDDGSASGGHDRVVLLPNADEPRTFLEIRVRDLDRSVVADDLSDLHEGMIEGLRQLPGVDVEGHSEMVLDNLIRLEAVYSFVDGRSRLKRRTWLLFVDRWQYSITWQGSSPEEYEHWLAMASYSFGTFELPPALWLATGSDALSRVARQTEGEPPA
jgi:hypothetical protein